MARRTGTVYFAVKIDVVVTQISGVVFVIVVVLRVPHSSGGHCGGTGGGSNSICNQKCYSNNSQCSVWRRGLLD